MPDSDSAGDFKLPTIYRFSTATVQLYCTGQPVPTGDRPYSIQYMIVESRGKLHRIFTPDLHGLQKIYPKVAILSQNYT